MMRMFYLMIGVAHVSTFVSSQNCTLKICAVSSVINFTLTNPIKRLKKPQNEKKI